RALLALFRLIGALLESPLSDDTRALGERTRNVFGELAPHAPPQEEGFPVFPLVRLAVERAGGRRDGEVRHSEPALRVAQFWIAREVSHDGDDGVAGHELYGFRGHGRVFDNGRGLRSSCSLAGSLLSG